MDDKDFESLIQKAIADIPRQFKEKLENVSIVIQDWPSAFQIKKIRERGETGILLGLYEGIPKTKRGYYGIGGQLPDKITIFKNSILMISNSRSNVIKIVKDTVIHEIAHHFGIDDEKLREIGK